METKETYRIKDLMIVRPTNPEHTSYIITIGNELATNEIYESEEEANHDLDRVNWDLVASVAKIIAEVAICKSKNQDNEKKGEVENESK